MAWRLIVSPRAERDLARLPERDREAVRRVLRRMADDPGTSDIRKLGGRRGEWRVRVGRWRVTLELDNEAGVINVTRVLPRKEAYRD